MPPLAPPPRARAAQQDRRWPAFRSNMHDFTAQAASAGHGGHLLVANDLQALKARFAEVGVMMAEASEDKCRCPSLVFAFLAPLGVPRHHGWIRIGNLVRAYPGRGPESSGHNYVRQEADLGEHL